MILNKETLQDFITNYPIPFDSLTDESYQQAYLDGIKDVLSDLESTFLSDNSHVGITLDSYLESDELIDQCIQQVKVNLAKGHTV